MASQEVVNKLIIQSKKATPEQLARLIDQASVASFIGDLLEADEALWGSFWQGDVIAPGYLLPAVELALLRATRLDGAWPEQTSVTGFLADLRQAIRHPQAGVWALRAAGEPCVIFAAPLKVEDLTLNVVTVVWYCATTGQLYAGYRAAVDSLNFPGGIAQRPLMGGGATPRAAVKQPGWLEGAAEQPETLSGQGLAVGGPSLAARLDAEILRIRLGG